MTSRYPSQISQELLSAYIDGEVNTQEQRLVEEALAADPEIVWQVESLRHTVALLADLPAIALPQSFVLSEARVADVVATRRAARRQSVSHTAPSGDNVWQKLFAFLGGGNLLLRNAAAVAAVAFFVLMAGDAFTGAPAVPTPQAVPALAQAEVQAESAALTEIAEMPAVAQEMPAAKAMPASQDAAQDAEPAAEPAAELAAQPAAMSVAADATQPSPESADLIPDASPMSLGAEPRT
nr:zf-HC2 domain-containing protein [Caldilineaceae bacterium]